MQDLVKIVDQLSSLTLIQVAELIKLLEEKWGVSANNMYLPPISTSTNIPVQENNSPEKNEFDLVLLDSGSKKIEVIKIVRELTSLGLKEAKDLVDNAPKTVKQNLNKTEAEDLKAKLESAGAKVEVK